MLPCSWFLYEELFLVPLAVSPAVLRGKNMEIKNNRFHLFLRKNMYIDLQEFSL